MQTRRRFQPMVDGLPYRIAPSSVAAIAPAATTTTPIVTAYDTDMTESGSFGELILAPPKTGGDGTLVC